MFSVEIGEYNLIKNKYCGYVYLKLNANKIIDDYADFAASALMRS